jgi:hypothetical protein
MEAIGSCSNYPPHLEIDPTGQVQKHAKNRQGLAVKNEPHQCNVGCLNQIYHFSLNYSLPACNLLLTLWILHPQKPIQQQPGFAEVPGMMMTSWSQKVQSFHSLSL